MVSVKNSEPPLASGRIVVRTMSLAVAESKVL